MTINNMVVQDVTLCNLVNGYQDVASILPADSATSLS